MPFKSKQANYDACMVSGYDGVFSRKQGSMHLEQLLVRFQVTWNSFVNYQSYKKGFVDSKENKWVGS